ncbi:MAG: amidohydrolase family protein [Acidobacteriota bacterium]
MRRHVSSSNSIRADGSLWFLGVFLALMMLPAAGWAQSTLAFRGGTVITVTGSPIEGGVVLVRDGKIIAVGKDVSIPADAAIVETRGKFVMPGLVDAMTHFGIRPFNLNSQEQVTPENRAVEAYYPFGDFFKGKGGVEADNELLYGGVTTVYIAPGSTQLIGGQGAVVKTCGASYDGLILRDPASIDMALPPRPPREGTPPGRMAAMALLRKTMIGAQEYDRRVREYNEKSDDDKKDAEKPPRDMANEALQRLLHRELPARVEADFVEDITAAMRLAEEFGFNLIIDSGIAAYQLKEVLAQKKIPVVVGKISHPFAPEYFTYPQELHSIADERNAAWLTRAGVKVAIASYASSFGGKATQGRWLLIEAALATAYGMSEEDALKAVTINAAEILGVDGRVGSIEPGKDADLIILDGPPLGLKTWVERVYIDGTLAYQRGGRN